MLFISPPRKGIGGNERGRDGIPGQPAKSDRGKGKRFGDRIGQNSVALVLEGKGRMSWTKRIIGKSTVGKLRSSANDGSHSGAVLSHLSPINWTRRLIPLKIYTSCAIRVMSIARIMNTRDETGETEIARENFARECLFNDYNSVLYVRYPVSGTKKNAPRSRFFAFQPKKINHAYSHYRDEIVDSTIQSSHDGYINVCEWFARSDRISWFATK